MVKLFGIDIAAVVAREFKGKLLTGTLTKRSAGSRTAGSLTGGVNPSETAHPFEGIVETKTETRREDGGLVTSTGEILTIIGGSLPAGVVPEANDRAELEKVTYDLIELIERDPASAVYRMRVEATA